MTVAVAGGGLVFDGAEHLLLSGEVHYWRLDPERWASVLDAVAGLGFRTVSTYVSWARHERAPGLFDFTGPLDVERFLRLVAEHGLRAVVRIGPNTAAEQEDSGWPRRVLDDPSCQARRPGGAPYLLATATHHAFMPSYAAATTRAEIAGWYDEIVPRLAPLQHPDGPIVAVQVDNELGFHFQSHAFALDHHPDAIEEFRSFLADRYGTIEQLNDAYGWRAAAFANVPAPTDGTAQPERWRVDWVEFREHHLRATLSHLASLARQRGLDRVPYVHNDYPRTTTPHDIGGLEQSAAVDVAGADIYVTKEGGRFVTDLARHLVGSSKLPYMAELGTGWLTFPWLLPMRTTATDEAHAAMRALLGGVRAANVYMLVERDRWYGSPIDATGQLREEKASFYRRLTAMLDELEWTALRRDVSVLVVENRDEARRAASQAILGDLVPPFSQMLPLDRRMFESDEPSDAALDRWSSALTQALWDAGIDVDRASSSALPDLARYSHVVVPRLDRLAPQSRGRLEASPAIVLTAPADGTDDPAGLVAQLPAPVFRRGDRRVDLVRFVGPGREVLAAANGSNDEVDVAISFDGAVTLDGRWAPERLEGHGCVRAHLQPWAVQLWEVGR